MTVLADIVARHFATLEVWRRHICVCNHSRSDHAGIDGLDACRYPGGCTCTEFAIAVLVGADQRLDVEQLQSGDDSVQVAEAWAAYAGLSPLEQRYADGDR